MSSTISIYTRIRKDLQLFDKSEYVKAGLCGRPAPSHTTFIIIGDLLNLSANEYRVVSEGVWGRPESPHNWLMICQSIEIYVVYYKYVLL